MCLLLGQENSPEMIWWSFFAIVDGDKLHLTGSRRPRWITSSSCRKDGNPRISKSVLWESTIRISSSTRPSQHAERPPRRSRTSELGQLGRFAMSATLSSAMLSIAMLWTSLRNSMARPPSVVTPRSGEACACRENDSCAVVFPGLTRRDPGLKWKHPSLVKKLRYNVSISIDPTHKQTKKSPSFSFKHPTDSSHHSCTPDAPSEHRPDSSARAKCGTSSSARSRRASARLAPPDDRLIRARLRWWCCAAS